MLLSVLSALARLDVDPWQEADELARLPGDTATQRLASLIAALPDGPSAHLDPGAVATRLIALLPHPVISNARMQATSVDAGIPTHSRLSTNLVLIAIYIVAFLIYQFASAPRNLPAQRDPDHAPTSLTVPAQTPPTTSGSPECFPRQRPRQPSR